MGKKKVGNVAIACEQKKWPCWGKIDANGLKSHAFWLTRKKTKKRRVRRKRRVRL